MNENDMIRHTDEADACFYNECDCCNNEKGDDDNE